MFNEYATFVLIAEKRRLEEMQEDLRKVYGDEPENDSAQDILDDLRAKIISIERALRD